MEPLIGLVVLIVLFAVIAALLVALIMGRRRYTRLAGDLRHHVHEGNRQADQILELREKENVMASAIRTREEACSVLREELNDATDHLTSVDLLIYSWAISKGKSRLQALGDVFSAHAELLAWKQSHSGRWAYFDEKGHIHKVEE